MATAKKGFTCEGCGSALDYALYKGGIIECQMCFRQNTVPQIDIDDESKQLMFRGKFDLKARKFDDARLAFSELAERRPEEAEAYWGMALSEFNVQYVYDINKESDDASDKLQVLCKEVDKKFTDSDNYKKAIKYASKEQKKVYERKGADIDNVREQFLHFKDEQHLEYDCFICVKVTEELLDENGNKRLDEKGRPRTKKTTDSFMAAEIYDFLKEKGFKPFYSEKEIKGRTGEAYEAMILYALYKSECMLVVCNDEKYLQTPWVKSEYTRFLELINDKEKASTSITTIFDGNPIDKLDGKNGRIQGIDKSRSDWEDLLYDYVMDHSPTGRQRKLEAQQKREAEEAEKRRIADEERRKKEAEERKQKEALAAMQAKLEDLEKTRTATAPLDRASTMNVKKMVKYAYELLDGRKFKQANDKFDEVLQMDSDNCDAWWGMFLVEMQAANEDEIIKKIDSDLWKEIMANPFYCKACAKAEQSSKDERVDVFNKNVKNGELWWKFFLKDFSVKSEKDLLKRLSIDLLVEIDENPNYNFALEYADGSFKTNVVDPFTDQFSSTEIWWGNFLKDFKVKDSSEILKKMHKNLLDQIEANKNYGFAIKYIKGDSSVERIASQFDKTIHSPLFWWKKFMLSMGIDERDFLDEEFDDGVIVTDMSYSLKQRIKDNEAYRLAIKFAEKTKEEEFEKHYQKFKAMYESPYSYYQLFLEDFGVYDDEQLLSEDVFDIDLLSRVKKNENFKIVMKKGDDFLRVILDDIIAGMEYQKKSYDEAGKMLKSFAENYSCKKINELSKVYEDGYLKDNPEFARIRAKAKASHVKDFISKIDKIQYKQAELIDEKIKTEKAMKKGKTKTAATGIIVLIIGAVLFAVGAIYERRGLDFLFGNIIEADFFVSTKFVVVYYLILVMGALSVIIESFRRARVWKRIFRSIGCVVATAFATGFLFGAEYISSLLGYGSTVVEIGFAACIIACMAACLIDGEFGKGIPLYIAVGFYLLYYYCYAYYFPGISTIFWQDIVVLILTALVVITILVSNISWGAEISSAWGILAPYVTLFLFCVALMAYYSTTHGGKFWPAAWAAVTLFATLSVAYCAVLSFEAYSDLASDIKFRKKRKLEEKQNKALAKVKK